MLARAKISAASTTLQIARGNLKATIFVSKEIIGKTFKMPPGVSVRDVEVGTEMLHSYHGFPASEGI